LLFLTGCTVWGRGAPRPESLSLMIRGFSLIKTSAYALLSLVLLAGLGGLKDKEEGLESEVRLLYVGMTRARQQLLLKGSGENWFWEELVGGWAMKLVRMITCLDCAIT
jgi:hypothetical protein